MRNQFYAARPLRYYKCALSLRGPYADGTRFAACRSQLQMQALELERDRLRTLRDTAELKVEMGRQELNDLEAETQGLRAEQDRLISLSNRRTASSDAAASHPDGAYSGNSF